MSTTLYSNIANKKIDSNQSRFSVIMLLNVSMLLQLELYALLGAELRL